LEISGIIIKDQQMRFPREENHREAVAEPTLPMYSKPCNGNSALVVGVDFTEYPS
jgi:hypothetical protein